MKLKCSKCNYVWKPRTDDPRSCPDCKNRLSMYKPIVLSEDEGLSRNKPEVIGE